MTEWKVGFKTGPWDWYVVVALAMVGVGWVNASISCISDNGAVPAVSSNPRQPQMRGSDGPPNNI